MIAKNAVTELLHGASIEHLFKGSEVELFDFVIAHAKKHGALPALATVLAHTGEELPNAPEPPVLLSRLDGEAARRILAQEVDDRSGGAVEGEHARRRPRHDGADGHGLGPRVLRHLSRRFPAGLRPADAGLFGSKRKASKGCSSAGQRSTK